jgi:hypothetical protein
MKNKKSLSITIYILLFILLVVIVFIYVDNLKKTKINEVTEIKSPYTNLTVYNGYRIYEKKTTNLTLYYVEAFDSNDYKYTFSFRYYPTELKDVLVESDIYDKVLYGNEAKTKYKSKIYISVNPNMSGLETLSALSVAQILWQGTKGHEGVYKIPTQIAYSSDYEGDSFPIKTCEDATQEVGIILIKYGDMKIYSDDYCVILQGNNLEELRMVNEKLSYMLLKVI